MTWKHHFPKLYGVLLAASVTELRSRGFVVTCLDDESGEKHSLAPAEGDLALVARRDRLFPEGL